MKRGCLGGARDEAGGDQAAELRGDSAGMASPHNTHGRGEPYLSPSQHPSPSRVEKAVEVGLAGGGAVI